MGGPDQGLQGLSLAKFALDNETLALQDFRFPAGDPLEVPTS